MDVASQLIYTALELGTAEKLSAEFDKTLDRVDPSHALDVLAPIVVSSTDPIERAAALLILNGSRAVIDAGDLPVDAYRDLAIRPMGEVAVLAQRHKAIPVPPRAAPAFIALGRSSDKRAQRLALLALGHPETADALMELMRTLPPHPGVLGARAHALLKCCLACEAEFQRQLAEGTAEERAALYGVLEGAPAECALRFKALVSARINGNPQEAQLHPDLMEALEP
jgi:hypothetical protein